MVQEPPDAIGEHQAGQFAREAIRGDSEEVSIVTGEEQRCSAQSLRQQTNAGIRSDRFPGTFGTACLVYLPTLSQPIAGIPRHRRCLSPFHVSADPDGVFSERSRLFNARLACGQKREFVPWRL